MLFCHDLVTDRQVLSVEDLLEAAPNEFLVGFRHGCSLIVSTTAKEV
jgi:hypothetical protein